MDQVAGLVLAAGAGTRMGKPKALLRSADGVPFVRRAVGLLHDAGCSPLVVVTGASAAEVTAVLHGLPAHADVGPGVHRDEPQIDVVEAPDWHEGMGASLRTGLRHLARTDVLAVVVTLVDLPGITPAAVRRLLDAGAHHAPAPSALVRACFDGVPGHPVLIGRDHWAGVLSAAVGDRGARDYLQATPHRLVECSDIASGEDLDTPADLTRHQAAHSDSHAGGGPTP